jgi:sugar phosphate isomerase/epimerase
MKLSQVAAQLYTVRDFCKTALDLAASLKKIRAIGYPAVQVSGIGPIAEDELVKRLAGAGLICCATHEPGQKILDEPQAVVARLKKIGCRHTAYPYPGGVDFSTLASLKSFAGKLNAAGKALHDAGLVLSYHIREHLCSR